MVAEKAMTFFDEASVTFDYARYLAAKDDRGMNRALKPAWCWPSLRPASYARGCAAGVLEVGAGAGDDGWPVLMGLGAWSAAGEYNPAGCGSAYLAGLFLASGLCDLGGRRGGPAQRPAAGWACKWVDLRVRLVHGRARQVPGGPVTGAAGRCADRQCPSWDLVGRAGRPAPICLRLLVPGRRLPGPRSITTARSIFMPGPTPTTTRSCGPTHRDMGDDAHFANGPAGRG